jgi:hypothetical protein
MDEHSSAISQVRTYVALYANASFCPLRFRGKPEAAKSCARYETCTFYVTAFGSVRSAHLANDITRYDD